jgi:hypothetical protein
MQGKNFKLVLDTFCEVYDLLKPWADDHFWDLTRHNLVPGAVYLIGRQQMVANAPLVREMAESGNFVIVHSNPAEGSETLRNKCYSYGIDQLVLDRKILLLSGGEMAPDWPYMLFDSFLPKVLDYEENIQAIEQAQAIFTKTNKPYKFLFLNGRMRPSRKYLVEQFNLTGVLDQSLWSLLDGHSNTRGVLKLMHQGQDLMKTSRPVKYLDPAYEVDAYSANVDRPVQESYVKPALFNNDWGEIYLKAAPYVDTYFSVVTETVFDYPYSFRTEKIWKPIAMGHPWIAVANEGYYRDMHNLGFRTFDSVIDESFDLIPNSQDRIERIAQVVDDLCGQDLVSFLKECYNTCKYNQQHLADMRVRVRKEFPDRFHQFIQQHLHD